MNDRTAVTISEEVKNDTKESESIMSQSQECDKESESKMLSICSKLMLRLFLLSTGLLMFISAFLKAMKITGFNATKLILLEICMLVLLVFFVGILVALAKMRHESKAKGAISVLLYSATLIAIVSFLLVWAFFKATPF